MFTVDYFIAKFEAIPEEKIIERLLLDRKGNACVNGWCGADIFFGYYYSTPESLGLCEVFKGLSLTEIPSDFSPYRLDHDDSLGYSSRAAMINNGHAKEYQQPTPKQRILAALRDIKAQQEAVNDAQTIVNQPLSLETT